MKITSLGKFFKPKVLTPKAKNADVSSNITVNEKLKIIKDYDAQNNLVHTEKLFIPDTELGKDFEQHFNKYSKFLKNRRVIEEK